MGQPLSTSSLFQLIKKIRSEVPGNSILDNWIKAIMKHVSKGTFSNVFFLLYSEILQYCTQCNVAEPVHFRSVPSGDSGSGSGTWCKSRHLEYI